MSTKSVLSRIVVSPKDLSNMQM